MTNEQTVYNFFKEKGLSDNAVYAIMGNIKQESNFSTTDTNSSSGAYGLFQWLGGRKSALQSYAASQGKAASDINVQLEYAWKELNGSEKATLNYLQSNGGKSVAELARGFESKFERSGGSAVEKRVTYAEQFASGDYSSGSSTSSSGSSESSSGSSEEVKLNVIGMLLKGLTIILVIVLGVVFLSLCVKQTVDLDPMSMLQKGIEKVKK